VLVCVHHIQWVVEVPGGLHQCIQCTQVVSAKEIYPKLEDLSAEFRRRWEAHEATRPPPAAPAPHTPLHNEGAAPASPPAGTR
jgi:hypothetical protein